MFKKRFLRFVFREQAGADGASGGAAAGAGEAGAAAGAGDTGAAAAATSVLAAGAAASGENTTDYIPEKYRTNKEDGTFDLDASSRKMADAYGNLEKRFGSGDVPPKDASEYKITVPDALKEAFDPATDPGLQAFTKGAIENGFTQSQMDFVMENYFTMAPKLAAGAAQYDAATATAELKQTWATDADFNRNVRNAYVGTEAAAQKAGLDVKAIMEGPLGNSPTFLKLMAALGPEFQEDAPPGGSKMTTEGDINALLVSEAYTNPRHIDHAKTSEQVRKYFERKHGTEAAA